MISLGATLFPLLLCPVYFSFICGSSWRHAGLYAGDLTGKALVPLVREDGGWTGELGGRRERARDGEELVALERRIADHG